MICFFARLGDGTAAGENMDALIAKSALPNLFSTHPPFQIDGNFGGVAGVCEMLVQSHAGEIELLPALPPNWQTGSVKGLRARGGYEVDVAWRDGKLESATVRNISGSGKCKIRHGGKLIEANIAANAALALGAGLEVK
jgi:alpha-L-fucosidase 2